jgi:hypothetical protein
MNEKLAKFATMVALGVMSVNGRFMNNGEILGLYKVFLEDLEAGMFEESVETFDRGKFAVDVQKLIK